MSQVRKVADVLHTVVPAWMKHWRVPGAAVLVLHHGDLAYEGYFGVQNIDTRAKVDARTRFYIASTTKAFTAMSVALLAADGHLVLREPVLKRIPQFVFYDAYTSGEVTWIDLLSHRTGVGDSDALLNAALARHDLMLAQADRKPVLPFRAGWCYCNELYAVVGHLVELVAGCPWESFVDQRIFQPLGMRDCDFAWLHRIGDADRAATYVEQGGQLVPIPLPPGKERQEYEVGAPAGSINAKPRELLPWMLMHLQKGRSADGQFIPEPLLQEILMPRAIIGAPHEPEFSQALYGLGWVLQWYKGHTVAWHDGSTGPYVSFLPDDDAAVIVLANKPSPLARVVTYTVYDHLLDCDHTDWAGRNGFMAE
jgi:CubicO group peptidase (beta-lactamase class C family)